MVGMQCKSLDNIWTDFNILAVNFVVYDSNFMRIGSLDSWKLGGSCFVDKNRNYQLQSLMSVY